MKKFFLSNWQLISIIFLSGFIIWPLFLPGYFSHHDYLQIIRIFEMRKCILDLQIPCRWIPDMGFGYGFPLFNYYGVFPYYLGAIASFVIGYVGAAKFLFFIPLIMGGISMYILAREVFGKDAGFISGVLYLFAPYRALDSYVRGAIAESFAIAIIPIVFYFSLRLIRKTSLKNFLGLTISLSIFLLNHNLMTLVFIPVLLVWILFWIVSERKTRIWPLIISFILSVGISTFYLIPSYFEKNLVQIENLKESAYIPNFRAHFVTLKQLFISRFWGYGASTWLEEDGISFQVGWPHWWLVMLGFLSSLFGLMLSKKQKRELVTQEKLIILFTLVFLASVLMTHNKSAFIWEKIETLQFFQFPWRFLSLSIFSASLVGGFIINYFKGKIRIAFLLLVVILTVSLNWMFFKPDKFYLSINDKAALSGSEWDFQRQGAIVDYLPKGAIVPKDLAPAAPSVLKGKAEINNFVNKTNEWEFKAQVLEDSTIEVPVFDFPNWVVKVDGKVYNHNAGEFGRITFDLPTGDYYIVGEFRNTPLRNYANVISLFSIVFLVCLSIYAKNRKVFV